MADISKIKPDGTTYNLKDSYARNMESLDSTERLVGVGHDGVSPLYKKTVKYTKAANSAASLNITPNELGMTTLRNIQNAECWMEEYQGGSETVTALVPAPIVINVSSDPSMAWYIGINSDRMVLRISTQYQASKIDMYFTFWYTK